MQREFELCAETLQACQAAASGDADRIELCAALGEGGVTPSLGFLREVVRTVSLPVHVLLRPRSGNFVYAAAEYRMLRNDLDDALTAGATGVVLGLLTPENKIDTVRTQELVQQAAGHAVTFHRAFDQAPDQITALNILIDMGCSRVLTSGGKPTVTEGRDALTRLAAHARGQIRIAAGGGVTLSNAASFTSISGLDLHASLRSKAAAQAGDPLWADAAGEVDADDVRRICKIVHAS